MSLSRIYAHTHTNTHIQTLTHIHIHTFKHRYIHKQISEEGIVTVRVIVIQGLNETNKILLIYTRLKYHIHVMGLEQPHNPARHKHTQLGLCNFFFVVFFLNFTKTYIQFLRIC